MDAENYLERLRSIREKYGCQRNYQQGQKNTEFLYPLTQTGGYQPRTTTKQEQSLNSYSPFRQDKDLDFSKEKLREINSRPSRYYSSVDKRRMRDIQNPVRITQTYGKTLGQKQLSEAQLKRQDNFNQFISDLDKRIEEKERMINEKFKENQLVLKKTELQTPDRQKMKRSESHNQLREGTFSSKLNYNYSISRQAYNKSKSITKRYERQQQNIENEVSTKINWNRSPKINIDNYQKIIRGTPTKKLNLTPSQDYISKKLEGGSMIRNQGFNTQKLENIQQRIQSVLKQSNR